METFFKDLKHSLRMFRQNPGFTATAVAALVIGIGLTPRSSRWSTRSC